MRKLMAVFAVLIFLCTFAQAAETPAPMATPTPLPRAEVEGVVSQFTQTRMRAWALGEQAAYVLDRDGQLFRWAYDADEPSALCTLPVLANDAFAGGSYQTLSATARAQVDETVNMLAVDGETLYALNKYSGRIGTVDAQGVHWRFTLDENPFFYGDGGARLIQSTAVLDHQLYLLLDCFEEAPAADWCSRILRIDLVSGASQLYDTTESCRLCAYKDGLLLLCEGRSGCYLMCFDPDSATTERLSVTPPASSGALTYDASSDSIYLVSDAGVYRSVQGGAFNLVSNLPSDYAGAVATLTSDGRLASVGGGVWVLPIGENAADALTVRLHSADLTLRRLFTQAYPDVLLDWQVDTDMTAADVVSAIRSGDTTTAVFSVRVDSTFASLTDKGFAAALTNADLVQSVADMRPTLSAPLKSASGAVLAYPWDMDIIGWTVNRTLWDRYFPDEALPTTWADFFRLMQTFEQLDNPDGDLFLLSYDAEELVEDLLTAYVQRQHMRGEPVDFTDAAFTEALAELGKVRQILQARGVDSYDESEIFWDSEVGGEHSLFHVIPCLSTHSASLWNENILTPFVFSADDTPVYTASMRVLVVNPNLPDTQLAEAFIALVTTQEYSVMHRYVFQTSAVQPFEQKPYTVTAEAIAQWQAAVDSVCIMTDEPLLSDSFLAQARMLIRRYAAGQVDSERFLALLNETAEMVRMEMN